MAVFRVSSQAAFIPAARRAASTGRFSGDPSFVLARRNVTTRTVEMKVERPSDRLFALGAGHSYKIPAHAPFPVIALRMRGVVGEARQGPLAIQNVSRRT